VTEADWDRCSDPAAMLHFLRDSGRASDRKLGLFAVACCRRIWPLLADERSRKAVEVAERYADGMANQRELRFAFSRAADAYAASSHTADRRAAAGAANAARPEAGYYARYVTPRKEHPALLRDVFGPLPFREVHIDPSLLTKHDGLATKLAQAAYDHRDLPAGTLDRDRLAVLADALEDAGLTDAQVLDHLRSAGPHVRGCFAVDAILGRE
jgi:hypothetical protein